MNRYNGKGGEFRRALLFLPFGFPETVVPPHVERTVGFWYQQKFLVPAKV